MRFAWRYLERLTWLTWCFACRVKSEAAVERSTAPSSASPIVPTSTTKDDLTKMRSEMERLRERNRELEERVLDLEL